MPGCRSLFVVAAAVAGFTSAALAAEKLDVKGALERRIIDPQLPLKEVEDYSEGRILSHHARREVGRRVGEASRPRATAETLEKVVFRGEAAAWRDAATKVEWLDTIAGGPGYRIKKLRYEAVPGLWIPALLYEPEGLSGKAPVMLNVNGHDGKRQGRRLQTAAVHQPGEARHDAP